MSETYINLINEEPVKAQQYRELEEGSNNLDFLRAWVISHGRFLVIKETSDYNAQHPKLKVTVLDGWMEVNLTDWVVYTKADGFLVYPNDLFESTFKLKAEFDKPESNLVTHARTELALIGEDPEVIEGYIKIIQAFADMGHSGGSASVAIPTINALLQYKNLKPLTNDPDEWLNHGPNMGGEDGEDFWQSKRNSEAFSHDGGKTYYLLSEGAHSGNRQPIHTSEEKK